MFLNFWWKLLAKKALLHNLGAADFLAENFTEVKANYAARPQKILKFGNIIF